MKHLKDLNSAPPGSWRFTEPSTGFAMTAVTFASLVGKVAQHRQNMGIPEDPKWRLDEIVEDCICNSLSQVDQLAHCQTGVRKRAVVGWREIMRFLETVVKWVAQGAELVPTEEAERRAAICVNCPLQVGMGGCAPCKVAVNAFRATMWQRSTSHDAGLRHCGVCGCDNKTQVHIPLDVLTHGREHLTYPDFCWKKAGPDAGASATPI